MAEWQFQEWLRFGLVTLAIFAGVSGIVSQTTQGASGRGFMEGMWKGVEWWFIALVVVAVLYGAAPMMGITATAVNTGM